MLSTVPEKKRKATKTRSVQQFLMLTFDGTVKTDVQKSNDEKNVAN